MRAVRPLFRKKYNCSYALTKFCIPFRGGIDLGEASPPLGSASPQFLPPRFRSGSHCRDTGSIVLHWTPQSLHCKPTFQWTYLLNGERSLTCKNASNVFKYREKFTKVHIKYDLNDRKICLEKNGKETHQNVNKYIISRWWNYGRFFFYSLNLALCYKYF